MSEEFHGLAPAKINLSLKVQKGIYPHPFLKNTSLHKLESVMMRIPLFDEISIRKTKRKKIQMHFSGPFSHRIPNNSNNTIYSAAEYFFSTTGFSSGVDIVVEKNIPSASGLGGASSDGATVLHLLEKLFPEKGEKLSPQDWNRICLSVGSDIPFFFSEEPIAKVKNFGEEITPLEKNEFHGNFLILMKLPRIDCNTKWAFETLDTWKNSHDKRAFESLANDFEFPMFSHFPDLLKIRNMFRDGGAKKAGLSGSGSVIYGIWNEKKRAERVHEKIKNEMAFSQILEI